LHFIEIIVEYYRKLLKLDEIVACLVHFVNRNNNFTQIMALNFIEIAGK